jgi:uncharacterized integral membrane protein
VTFVPRNIYLVISAALIILMAVLGFMNANAATALNLMGSNVTITLGTILFGSFAVGFVSALCFNATSKLKDIKSEQNQLEWQKQDQKLAIEIQSDKEKQLEAKIQTLEIALKSALDKAKKKTTES